MDIRLKTAKYTLDEKEYTLCCNMNVLAEVQEQQGGNISALLNGNSMARAALIFGAAMLNDCADENGWSERFTAKSLGRKIPLTDMDFVSLIIGLVGSAIGAEKSEDAPETEAEETEKN